MKLICLIALILILGCGRKEKITYLSTSQPPPQKITPEEHKEVKPKPKLPMKLSWKRDPFLSMEEQGLKVSEELEKINEPKLSAIIYSPEHKLAIIEGKILKVGDKVDSKEIVEIKPEGVVLKEAGKLYLLKLEDVSKVKEISKKHISPQVPIQKPKSQEQYQSFKEFYQKLKNFYQIGLSKDESK
jgi:hypothetical protein